VEERAGNGHAAKLRLKHVNNSTNTRLQWQSPCPLSVSAKKSCQIVLSDNFETSVRVAAEISPLKEAQAWPTSSDRQLSS
jgi:hypothetical protein